MRLLATLLLIGVLTGSYAADTISSLQFADGRERSAQDFRNQPVILVYFSGQCPSARAWMGSKVKAVYLWLESNHINATLILITPDVPASELMDLDSSREYHMVNALYAYDPANPLHISLQNIYQVRLLEPNGSLQKLPYNDLFEAVQERLAPDVTGGHEYPYRISNRGLSDPDVVDAWWAVERGRPEAVQDLVSAAHDSQPGSQGRILLDRVTAFYTAQEASLCAAPATMETLESLETLLSESKGIPLKKAKARYHDLEHDANLKEELRARDEYAQCDALLHSGREQDRSDAKDGLAIIVSQSANTLYGRKAAARLQVITGAAAIPSAN